MSKTTSLACDFSFRFVLVGNSSVGKTSLLKRYVCSRFNDGDDDTIGVDFREKIINISGKKVRLQIWDASENPTYVSVYCNRANAIIVMYDVTSRDSFYNVDKWMKEVNKCCGNDVVKILVGNKSDLKDSRHVEKDLAEKVAKHLKINFVETSAKTGAGVNNIFMSLAEELMKTNVEKIKNDIYVDPESGGMIGIEKPKKNNRTKKWCVLF